MRRLLKHTDSELVSLLREGELKAFDELYYRYASKVMGFSRNFISDADEVEEAVQAVFVRIWERRNLLKKELSFKSYLFTSVKHEIYNRLRNQRKIVDLKEAASVSVMEGFSVLDHLEYEELEKATFQLIDRLPKAQRQVFTLNKLQGMSHKEIADQLGISVRTVERHCYVASKFLKGQLFEKVSVVAGLFTYIFSS